MTAAAWRMRLWPREVALFVAAYVLYSVVRGAADGSLESGLENARSVMAIQARLGIGFEAVVQEHLIGQPVMWLLNQLYLVAQFAVVPLALIWVYRRRRDLYPRLRTTVLATWAIALPVYALFPTAPPRLAGIGMVDTVSEQTRFALDSPLVMAFYNPIAAVPSLHAGFAIAVGVAVARSVRPLWAKVAALLWGPAIALVVIATGNHFVLDVVLGAVAVLVGYGVAMLVHRESPATARIRVRAPVSAAGAPLRVALLCPYDWHLPGGVRTHVTGLATALRRRGHHVDVVAAGTRRAVPDPDVRLVGATVPIRINGSVARIALTLPAAWRTWQALRGGRYDVVHLHEPIVPLVCWTALWLRRSALIATFHASSMAARPYRFARPLFGRLVRRVPAPIAVSDAARACARHVTDRPIAVIPNGIAPSRPSGGRRGSGGRRILFIGRNDPRKGLSVLTAALAGLPASIRLDVIGVSTEELDGVGIPAPARRRIDLHGQVGDDERQRLLDRADVLCAPSLGGESFGLVLLEAMAHGVPVVASDIGGYREVLHPRCGLVVPPGDARALARTLRAVLSDPALRRRLRRRGRAAAASYHWDLVAARLLERYRGAVIDHAADLEGRALAAPAPRPARAAAR